MTIEYATYIRLNQGLDDYHYKEKQRLKEEHDKHIDFFVQTYDTDIVEIQQEYKEREAQLSLAEKEKEMLKLLEVENERLQQLFTATLPYVQAYDQKLSELNKRIAQTKQLLFNLYTGKQQ